jgi:hypothetical protein
VCGKELWRKIIKSSSLAMNAIKIQIVIIMEIALIKNAPASKASSDLTGKFLSTTYTLK